MNATELLPYLFTVLAAVAVWVGVKRSRNTRNGVVMNGQSRLEERIRECEGTIRTLLADNVRKEGEIQALRQKLVEADRRIWQLERLLEESELDRMPSTEDQKRIARMEEADAIIRRLRDRRQELMSLETKAAEYGVANAPKDLQQRIAAIRDIIEGHEQRLQELSN